MKYLLVISSFFLLSSVCAQDVNLSSPYESIKTHLYYLQEEHYNDTLAAQPFNPKENGFEAARSAAVKLKRVLDGRGIYIYMDEIPRSRNYYDSSSNKYKYVLLHNNKKLYLLRSESDNNWYFSQSSYDEINDLYQATFRFGTGRLLDVLPKMGTKKVLGLYIYQYVAILLISLISAIVYRLFIFLTEKVFRQILIQSGYRGQTSQLHLWRIAKPTSFFLIVLLLILFIPILQLPPQYSQYIVLILKVLLPLLGTIIAYRFVNILSFYLEKLAKKTDSSLDDQMVPLLRKTLKTFIILTGTLFILDNLNVPILPLLTGLSIGGLAFALAAQDTLKNFFGSVMIFLDKPFQVGDWITSGSIDGTVEEVGFRSSRIRTFRNSLIYIPNGKLADNTIDNHGLRKYRRFYTQIAINYDTPPELIEVFTQGLREIVDRHPDTVKNNYHIYLNDMAASSLNVMFYIFFEVPNWGEELRARHEVIIKIIELAQQLGVNFAFPTQTLHIENLPGQPSLSPNYMDGNEAANMLKAFSKK